MCGSNKNITNLISAIASIITALSVIGGLWGVSTVLEKYQLIQVKLKLASQFYPRLIFSPSASVNITFDPSDNKRIRIAPKIKNESFLPVNITVDYYILSLCKSGILTPVLVFKSKDFDKRYRLTTKIDTGKGEINLTHSIPPKAFLGQEYLVDFKERLVKKHPMINDFGLITYGFSYGISYQYLRVFTDVVTPPLANMEATYFYSRDQEKKEEYSHCSNKIGHFAEFKKIYGEE